MTDVHCSKLSRVMSCPGILFFKDLPQDPPSEAAAEGTAAGEYIERILSGLPMTTHAKNGVEFNDDMKYFGNEIIAGVKALAESNILCETKIDWATRSGITVKGKYDWSFTVGSTLYIDDYKYGWGIVEPKENWQLLGYAIGEIMRRAVSFEYIVMRIHQPRPYHHEGPTREWKITYAELLKYKEWIDSHFDKIAQGFKDLQTGDQCRYCPALLSCPASNKAFFRGVEVAHEFLQDDISDNELAFQLDLLKRVEDMFKIRMTSLESLAVNRLKQGKVIPNYVSQPRYGDRKWKSGISPEFIKMMTGKDITELVMLSPAKAEKIGVPKELVADVVDRPFLGDKLKKVNASELGDRIFGKLNNN